MAAAKLDIPQLSSFCSLPQASINALLDSPTAELVRNLLSNISTKAHEQSELTSEKLRLGVELESAVRGQETKSRALKGSLDKSHKENAELRQKLQAEGMGYLLSLPVCLLIFILQKQPGRQSRTSSRTWRPPPHLLRRRYRLYKPGLDPWNRLIETLCPSWIRRVQPTIIWSKSLIVNSRRRSS